MHMYNAPAAFFLVFALASGFGFGQTGATHAPAAQVIALVALSFAFVAMMHAVSKKPVPRRRAH